jgi:hypothetical protein
MAVASTALAISGAVVLGASPAMATVSHCYAGSGNWSWKFINEGSGNNDYETIAYPTTNCSGAEIVEVTVVDASSTQYRISVDEIDGTHTGAFVSDHLGKAWSLSVAKGKSSTVTEAKSFFDTDLWHGMFNSTSGPSNTFP